MGLLDKLLGRGKAMADKVGLDDVADKVKDVAGGAGDKGKDVAGEAGDKGKDVAGEAGDEGKDAADN